MTDEFDDVLTQLESLRITPARSEPAARAGLQNFLNEAASLRPPVSAPPRRRLTEWISKFGLRSKFTQERSPMLALAIKLMVVAAVMLSGAGVTAAAAQNSLPNEALYPVKMFIEEVQWGSASGPEAQIEVQLEHAQQRVHEMAQLAERGTAVPEEVPARLRTQLQTALQVAAQLDDSQLAGALDRIQLRTQDQLREMDRIHQHDAAWQTAEGALTRTQEMAQLGRQDPQTFRARVGAGRPEDAPQQPQVTPGGDPSRTPAGPPASVTPQHTRTPQATCTPQHTPQPQASNTPQNHSYGPGPQSTPQSPATPVGQGDGHEYGPGPQSTNSPGSGTGEPQGSGGSQGGSSGGGTGSQSGGGQSGGGGKK